MKSSTYIIATALLLLSCDKGVENASSEFIVRVDSLSHTGFAAMNDTTAIRFFGTIGPDGCYSFSHFEAATHASALDITVYGQHEEASACPQVMVYLGGKEFRFIPAQMGWLKINVHQPDNTILRDSIIVK